VNNSNLIDIASEFGKPVYVYDSEKIAEQYHRLTAAFSKVKNLRINYATKALSNISILKFMKELGSGLDTVSIQEVKLGLAAGFSPEAIIYTPNGVSLNEIENVTKMGVQINIDNISILEQFGHEYGATIPVCIRLNPHIMAGGHNHISVGHIDSKFGVSIHQVPHLVRVVKTYDIKVNGFYMFPH
jgi:diaminopimelate decarboxylase